MQIRRSVAEGNVGPGLDLLLRSWQEATGVEAMRVAPELLVPVNRPGRDHDQGPLADPATADARGLHGDARQEGDRRIEPRRLPEDRAQDGQLLGLLEADRPLPDHRIHFRADRGRQAGLFHEQGEQPGQHARRGLVAREEEHAELVDEFPRERSPARSLRPAPRSPPRRYRRGRRVPRGAGRRDHRGAGGCAHRRRAPPVRAASSRRRARRSSA